VKLRVRSTCERGSCCQVKGTLELLNEGFLSVLIFWNVKSLHRHRGINFTCPFGGVEIKNAWSCGVPPLPLHFLGVVLS